MRSVTSSFNRTIYQKNMTRFWPIWVLYTMIFSFAMPIQVLVQKGSTSYPLQKEIFDTLWRFARYQDELVWIPFCFGVCIAMAVFGYLFSSRSACMVHALPVSRRGLYLTNYLSGLSMLLIPNLLILVLTISTALCRGVFEPLPVLGWFFCQSAAGVFFFSFASFCAMFTGNIMALPVFYGVLNFLVMGVGTLLVPFLSATLYGFSNYSLTTQARGIWLTPFAKMMESDVTRAVREYNVARNRWDTVGHEIDMAGIQIYSIYLVAGLIIALLGYLVYLRRETERAGDVVAEPRVYALFRYGIGFCGGLAMGTVNVALLNLSMDNGPLLMGFSVVWGVICYFVAEMLLEKSFKIFRASWKRAVVFAAVMFLVFASLSMDVLGYEKSVPQIEDVAAVNVCVGTHNDSYVGDFTQPEVLEKIVALHQAIAETGDLDIHVTTENQTSTDIYLNYVLQSGERINRNYDVVYFEQELDAKGSVTQTVYDLLDDGQFMAIAQGVDRPEEGKAVQIALEGYWDTLNQDVGYTSVDSQAERELVMDALERDDAAGAWREFYLFDDGRYQEYRENRYMASLHIEMEYAEGIPQEGDPTVVKEEYNGQYDTGYTYRSFHIDLTPQYTNTIQALHQIGLLDENHTLVTSDQADAFEANIKK